ncbi:MAG: hypothetical protein O2819_07180 [Planctomycetota bacterium]|nr:hypothetical protein [Planctomycetota bacterium]MDA1106269.1 hypothetical protein [Planctomycetota bacterium]
MIKANVLEQRRKERERAIDGLLAEAVASGGTQDRMYWTLVWDLEMAPVTTNAAQLAEIGYEPVEPEELDDGAIPAALGELIKHMATIGVYLMHTDHLTDRELYTRLVDSILEEQIRDLPPSPEVVEWVDMSMSSFPDGDDVYLSVYATDEERREQADADPTMPMPPLRARLVERDAGLPKP